MRIRLEPPRDMLVRDDSALLLYPAELIRLSGIGAAIARLAADWITLHDLTAALEEQFGSPEGVSAHEATRTAVTELVGRGVLAAK